MLHNCSEYCKGAHPFRSVECLKKSHVFPADFSWFDHAPWFYDAVHDIESLFWVLMFICLTQRRCIGRDMLTEDSARESLYHHFYWDSTLRQYKEKLFSSFYPQHMRSVINKFHPYFKVLEPMIMRWSAMLRMAYRYRRIEYLTIHDQVASILDDQIGNLSNGEPDGRAERKSE